MINPSIGFLGSSHVDKRHCWKTPRVTPEASKPSSDGERVDDQDVGKWVSLSELLSSDFMYLFNVPCIDYYNLVLLVVGSAWLLPRRFLCLLAWYVVVPILVHAADFMHCVHCVHQLILGGRQRNWPLCTVIIFVHRTYPKVHEVN